MIGSTYVHTGGSDRTEGHPVVLVHGAGMDHTVWRFQTRWLANRGYRVLAPDLAGHGASPGPARNTVPEWGEWLCSVLVERRATPATIVGHSMGSLIAVEAAAQQPDLIEGLVLVGTSPQMDVHPALMGAAEADNDLASHLLAGWSFSAAFGGGHPEPGTWEQGGVVRLLQRAAPGLLATDLNASRSGVSRADELTTDTLVVAGANDRITPAARAEELAAVIPGSRVIVLPGVGHQPMLQVPIRFNALLEEFLSRGKSGSR